MNGANNNEPFERGSGTLDWAAACTAAGFDSDDVFIQPVQATCPTNCPSSAFVAP